MIPRSTGAVALGLAAFVNSSAVLAAECTRDRVSLRGPWGQAAFRVEVADDPQERAQGLMFREEMPMTHGMLFLFEIAQPVSFWMKNTLIPLDMIFVQSDGTISRVHHNAVPHDLTSIDGGRGVIAVLEVNGGMAERLGISEGSEMQHLSLDQSIALWPCDGNVSD
ncbi:hypothetical protein SAMN04488030_1464 [Aliiroseovarius halocynthiae]|uniref:DUF192 domain-containing protein n=1 Tax=Aliiroseovarius halocynthiae TaxID=985055 RepID=A0A545SWI8_9RHOB|nr:DUF192 domain-containing protein [Aliiroseovarius halocynthiae]TQV69333.1 DUF192 domain-containing protein [Aliiroseovarius halocynthiae]SMR72191.1 hypothetical protein SAMN04488030_1464 [Aliiroseovarius halocynthiae]